MPQIQTPRKRRPAPMPMPSVLWQAREQPDVVRVPARIVLALDGQGEPEGARFQRSIGAAYNVAYTLKFSRKHKGVGEFRVAPLEARWWTDQPDVPFLAAPRSSWRWQVRMAIPDDITDAELAEAVAEVKRKKADADEASRIHVERVPEQTVGRAMHIGPYAEEARTLTAIRAALLASNLKPLSRHLEIYLGDPRRTAPAKLRTVVCMEAKTSS